MLRILVCVSGGGTNLQAVMDAIRDGRITNTEIVGVISNNKNAYALTRAGQSGIDAVCLSPRDFPDRAAFNQAFLDKVDSYSSGDHTGCHDRKLQEPYHQYPSFLNPFLLRRRVLWA